MNFQADYTGALTARQMRFVEEYLIDLNGTKAAIRAGYSKMTARIIASQNLKKRNIATAIAKAQQARSERTGITQDRVLLELERLAFSNIDHYLVDDAGHVALSTDAPPHAMSAVSKLKSKVSHKAFGANEVDETEVEIALWDKPSMLKLAGRHVGLFLDRIELTVKGAHPLMPAVSSLSDAELKAMLLDAASKL
jgi:phage terminase small subunit